MWKITIFNYRLWFFSFSPFKRLIPCFVTVKRLFWYFGVQVWPHPFLMCWHFSPESYRFWSLGRVPSRHCHNIIKIVKVGGIPEAVGGHENRCFAGLLTVLVTWKWQEVTGWGSGPDGQCLAPHRHSGERSSIEWCGGVRPPLRKCFAIKATMSQ